MQPFIQLKQWLDEEKAKGAIHAGHAILSTTSIAHQAHGRVVAIREISEESILFFTQKRTRKVEDIKRFPKVNLTFWFERMAREVMIDGEAHFLSEAENKQYWDAYSREAQIRFCSYAPTSGLAIDNKQLLENKRINIEQNYQNKPIPLSEEYLGITVTPKRFVFYSYRLDELSDVEEYERGERGFVKRCLSP